MALTQEQKQRLIEAAAQEGVDPAALVREADAMANGGAGADAGDGDGEPARMLVGFLPWIKVRELRERLGLGRIPDDEELCIAYGIKRGFIAPAATNGDKDDGS